MFRVFENIDRILDDLDRSAGLGSRAFVNREELQSLVDGIREALPRELDQAQDILDNRDDLLDQAQKQADDLMTRAEEYSDQVRLQADQEVAELREEADRQRTSMLASAQDEADAQRRSAEESAAATLESAAAEAERLRVKGQDYYDRAINEAMAEQDRLVSESEVIQRANEEARRIVEQAHTQSSQLRHDCDKFVEDKLASFEETLSEALRIVSRDRAALRRGAGVAGDSYTPRNTSYQAPARDYNTENRRPQVRRPSYEQRED